MPLSVAGASTPRSWPRPRRARGGRGRPSPRRPEPRACSPTPTEPPCSRRAPRRFQRWSARSPARCASDACLATMRELGRPRVIELPPAGALAGLAKREWKGSDVEVLALTGPEDLDRAPRADHRGAGPGRGRAPARLAGRRLPRAWHGEPRGGRGGHPAAGRPPPLGLVRSRPRGDQDLRPATTACSPSGWCRRATSWTPATRWPVSIRRSRHDRVEGATGRCGGPRPRARLVPAPAAGDQRRAVPDDGHQRRVDPHPGGHRRAPLGFGGRDPRRDERRGRRQGRRGQRASTRRTSTSSCSPPPARRPRSPGLRPRVAHQIGCRAPAPST
jgi:hypothetical protein